jgi:mitochondrial import inner membrane translocase subunit TIM44
VTDERCPCAARDTPRSVSASLFSQSEMSEALTEICRVDPTFDCARFLRIVQYDIVPNIFEVNETR